MEEPQVKDLQAAIDGLIWLSAESVGTRFFVDVSVWASRQEMQVEIVDLQQGDAAIYLDTTHGQTFTPETINTIEDRLIEKLADLKKPQEIAA